MAFSGYEQYVPILNPSHGPGYGFAAVRNNFVETGSKGILSFASRCGVKPYWETPCSIWRIISVGSSERGLSDVIITKSLPAAASAPIIGRFALSLSPATHHGNDAIGTNDAKSIQHIFQRAGRVRVVHEYQPLVRGNSLQPAWNNLDGLNSFLHTLFGDTEPVRNCYCREDIQKIERTGKRRAH